MKRLKIGLIVDNPQRDLNGLVLIGRELCRRGYQVFLIPMYSQGFEVPALGLDVVVLNYARKANTGLIDAYHKMGIFICVLDTEGGVWEDEAQFVGSVNHSECAEAIGLYFFWGKRQKQAFESSTKFRPEKLRVTGCPRYDFYHHSLLPAVPLLKEFKAPVILVISNFVLSDPRFVSSDQEIQNMVQAGYGYDYALKRREVDQLNRQALKEVIRKLMVDFPQYEIVIRPHPFEEDADYREEFGHREKVSVIRDGVIASWLRPSSVVIHCNSSVAIDAYMMKKPILTLGWVASELTRSMALMTYNLSCVATSYEHMKALIEASLVPPDSVDFFKPDPHSIEVLNSWFEPCDGLAHVRLADEIDSVKMMLQGPDFHTCRKFARFGSKLNSTWVGRLDYFGRLWFGAKRYTKLRSWVGHQFFGRLKQVDKVFDASAVEQILEKINEIENDGDAIRAVEPFVSDYLIPGSLGDSVMLELA